MGLAVKHPSTFTLVARLPTGLRVPLDSSVTLWEETAPVKLPDEHCPRPDSRDGLELKHIQGGISPLAPRRLAPPASQPPTYPTQT